MQKSDNIDELAKALAVFQSSIEAVSKDAQGYGYKYADLPSIWNYIRPALAANGLSIIQANKVVPTEIVGMPGIVVETLLMHSSGQFVSDECFLPMVKTDPQGAGSAITYARRYGLSSMLGIVSDEDDDGARGSFNRDDKGHNGGHRQQADTRPPSSGNNAAMQAKLDEAKPAEPVRQLTPEEIWGHGPAFKMKDEIADLAKRLKEAGDSEITGQIGLAAYVQERFDCPLATLPLKEVSVLMDDLTERLNERLAIQGEPSARPTTTEPMANTRQIDTLHRLCEVKNLKEPEVAAQFSEHDISRIEDMTELEIKEAIKQVQSMPAQK